MTLYYTIVFMLLVFEMGVFMMLIIPFPNTIRRKIFTFLSENPVVASIMYAMKITFIFILVLFIDSVQRVYRVQLELAIATEKIAKGGASVLGHERFEVQARKFYSQRNMYLCGFTLFLSLILNRTYVLITENIRLQDRLTAFESNKPIPGKGGNAEITTLKKELEKKNLDLETLKKQSEQLHKSYGDLSDKYEATQATEAKKGK
ncbi:hypothetical protein VHEMI04903 [[Torrubiella] hemipterigena]|uniref:Endoplasmic reticulum transmembrane protein n=1 Tax=[Torrubiella] hemipterigena TaxID=1531966 RepID=A0A0A1TF84_9HYPO|nr:hypothetical protein VHEMI04903 [[Torrubiella] hemipterigena]